MQLRWAEADLVLIGLCICAGLVFGGTWGSVVWIFYPDWGLGAGFVLGGLLSWVLYRKAQLYDPLEDEWGE